MFGYALLNNRKVYPAWAGISDSMIDSITRRRFASSSAEGAGDRRKATVK